MRWGTETPRAAPLWIPAFAGMTRAEDPLRVPSGQASTGSGRTDFGGAPLVGSGGCDGGRRRPAPRPSGFLPSPVRRWGWGGWRVLVVSGGGPTLAGRAIRESPLRRGVGVGSAKGVGDGGAPPAPLWIPAFAGMTRAEGPLRVPSGQASTGSGRTDAGSARAVGSGGAMGAETPRAAPLWIPAFAGTTVGVGGLASAAGVGRGSRSRGTGDSRIANRPYGVGWESGAQRGLVMGVPRPCPSGFLPSQE